MRNTFSLIIIILIFTVLGCVCGGNNNKPSSVNLSTINANTVATPPTSTPVPPSAKTSEENLELGKKALSVGDLSTARNHLSAIPKDTKEFASAQQYLAVVEKREKRKAVENELEQVKRDQANVEEMLDATEDFGEQAGSPKKALYLNALKRKGELQLKRIKLERQLKSMP